MGPLPPPSLLAVAGISLVLGFRHAFEPDHLAAVSTLATRQGSLRDAARLGAAWGVGHTASVAVVTLLLIAFGLRLPQRLWPAADFLVGLLLVTLGGMVLLRYARGRWHMHRHTHGESAAHLHLHSHEHDVGHAHAHARWDARRSLGFGLLHGLAGSGAIVVLLVATVPTRAAQLAYLAAFGAGTVLGMLSVSLALTGMVRAASRRGVFWATALHLGSAAASVTVGVLLAWRMAATP
jgi:ABC-type nickel/cobalt efflux system permease component RcnA